MISKKGLQGPQFLGGHHVSPLSVKGDRTWIQGPLIKSHAITEVQWNKVDMLKSVEIYCKCLQIFSLDCKLLKTFLVILQLISCIHSAPWLGEETPRKRLRGLQVKICHAQTQLWTFSYSIYSVPCHDSKNLLSQRQGPEQVWNVCNVNSVPGTMRFP